MGLDSKNWQLVQGCSIYDFDQWTGQHHQQIKVSGPIQNIILVILIQNWNYIHDRIYEFLLHQ